MKRMGVVIEASRDKGPFKLVRIRSEMREFTALIDDPYGVSGNPEKGSLVLVEPMGDGGLEIARPVDYSPKRFDRLKEGETGFVNTKTGTTIKLDEDGHVQVDGKADVNIKTAGNVNIGGAGGKRVARIGDKTSDGATIVEGSSKVFAVD